MANPNDTFTPTSEPYEWSNTANWSTGAVPSADSTVNFDTTGYKGTVLTTTDDVSGLTLGALDFAAGPVLEDVDVTGSALSIGTVNGYGNLVADASRAGAPVTVTMGSDSSGGGFGADGSGGVFIDQAASDPGGSYSASDGGLFELAATPSASSTLAYMGTASTIALEHPGASNAVALTGVMAGDVLELPGDAVLSASFGTNSLDVSTNDGTYDFTNVSYTNTVSGYHAAYDASTGLEAITLVGDDTFTPTSEPYEWSNTANWSTGAVPSADSTVNFDTTGYKGTVLTTTDDVSGLTLGALDFAAGPVLEDVDVTGSALSIGTVNGYGNLVADASRAGAPVTVTMGSDSSGGGFGADGSGGVFIDQAASDPGGSYSASDGGLFELAATPSASSTLAYMGTASTIALEHPGASNAVALTGVMAGDVLELPGDAVLSASFGTNSLDVSTNDGTYDFTNVSYTNTVSGYHAAYDASTGLEAITLVGDDTFTPTSEPYEWSNTANWSTGAVPSADSTVNFDTTGYKGTVLTTTDDVSGLTLGALDFAAGPVLEDVDVTGSALSIGTVNGYGNLVADASRAGAPVTVTMGSDSSGGGFGADGSGGVFIDQAASDPGGSYSASDGGLFELAATPSASSTLAYMGTASTIALEHPGASNAVALTGVMAGDVLELPGDAVLSASFGTNSLDVSTNDGTYDFTNVSYTNTVSGYHAAYDASTGLEAITLVGDDTFTPTSEPYEWSNTANWSTGAVPSADSTVNFDTTGYKGTVLTTTDDVSGLTLGALDFAAGPVLEDVDVTGSALSIGTVNGYGNLVADASRAGAPVTVTMGSDSSGGGFGADGSGGVFIDQAASDPGGSYSASDGGLFELAATPSASSTLAYMGTASTIALEHPGASNAVALTGVMAGDVLELPGDAVLSASFGTNSLDVSTNDGTYDFTNVSYTNTVSGYHAAYDASTGLEAITFVACFLTGTGILTDEGNVPIETLCIGDRVMTMSGEQRTIRWIGRRAYSRSVVASEAEITPVLIRAGALSEGVPFKDLRVSPGHAMYLDGILIAARDLANGATILQDRFVQPISYIHLELDTHDVIYAEGALTETFVDDGSRKMFDNAQDYWRQFPHRVDPAPHYCAPRIEEGWELERVRRRLAERARLFSAAAPSLVPHNVELDYGLGRSTITRPEEHHAVRHVGKRQEVHFILSNDIRV